MEGNILGIAKFKAHDEWLEEKYLEQINPIVLQINSSQMSFVEKMQFIYRYLVNKCSIKENFEKGQVFQTPHIIYDSNGKHGVTTTTKFCPVIYNVGVCKGFVEAYIDIASRVGIHLEEIDGLHYKKNGHGWIASIDSNGEVRHTDVYEGIKYREQGLDIMQAFMRTTDELYATGRYSNFSSSMNEAAEKLKKGFRTTTKTNNNDVFEEVRTGFKVRR